MGDDYILTRADYTTYDSQYSRKENIYDHRTAVSRPTMQEEGVMTPEDDGVAETRFPLICGIVSIPFARCRAWWQTGNLHLLRTA